MVFKTIRIDRQKLLLSNARLAMKSLVDQLIAYGEVNVFIAPRADQEHKKI